VYVRLVLPLLFISILFVSCKKEKEIVEAPIKEKTETNDFEISDPLLISQEVYSPWTFFAIYDSVNRVFVGIEEDSIDGIRFFAFDTTESRPRIHTKTPVHSGFRDTSRVKIIKLSPDSLSFIYYDTGSGYIGTGNVEIYQYLFSLDKLEFFSCYTQQIDRNLVNIVYSKNLKYEKYDFVKEYFNSILDKEFLEYFPSMKKIVKYE